MSESSNSSNSSNKAQDVRQDVRDVAELVGNDLGCFQKARVRGDDTFTLVGQDLTSPVVVCEWIKLNIQTAPEEKLRMALEHALVMRKQGKKFAD